MTILSFLEKRSHLFWIIIGLIAVIVIGLADYWTGNELAFSLFYLIPVFFVTWYTGRAYGLLIGLVSAAAWLTADALGGQVYSQPIIRYWNTAVRLGFFVVITLLLPALKELEREKQNARIDYLTGAANRRFFFEVFQRELDRAQRYQRPLTIAFIDLDEFKVVNDQLGHQVGDQILCNVVARISAQLRKTDLLARIGGDEFIILLPETDQDLSHTIISRIQSGLANEMQSNRWPVTFSIGVVTTSQIAITPDALIKQADAIMYSVKRGGKNAVAYAAQVG